MMNSQLSHLLRSPRGILLLFGITFAGAIILAIAAAFNRPFFEKYVREKYSAPVPLVDSLLQVKDSAEFQRKIKLVSTRQHLQMYEAWMSHPGNYSEQMPAWLLSGGSTDSLVARARVSLIAGSQVQRQQAALFLSRSGRASERALLQKERARAVQRREFELSGYIDQLLDEQ